MPWLGKGSVVLALLVCVFGLQVPRFRVRVDLVQIDVLVRDGDRIVRGLSASDFDVIDNGTPQEVIEVVSEEVPLDLLIVFDRSGSVAGEPIQSFRDAVRSVVSRFAEQDRIGILTFADPVELLVRFTHTKEHALAALDRLEPRGSTALYDALFAALLMRRHPNRRSVVLIDNGRDRHRELGRAGSGCRGREGK